MIRVDQSRVFVAEEENIVGKQVGVNHPLRQSARPVPFEVVEFGGDRLFESRLQAIGAAVRGLEQRPPAGDRERIRALER